MKHIRQRHQLRPIPPVRRSRGAVLVVGLIFLVLLMLIGVTAYSVATQEERQSGNTRDRIRALEGAEYALRICEAQLTGAVVPAFTASGTGGYYTSAENSLEVYQLQGFSWTNSPTHTVSDPQFDRKLRCVFERLEGAPIAASGRSIRAELPQSAGTVYRITARGEGTTSKTAALVQSYYQRD